MKNAWTIFKGHDYDINVKAWYKVAMEHKKDQDDAETEAYLATDHIFDGYSHIEVMDVQVTEVKTEKYFDIAEVEVELIVKGVTAHSHEQAYTDAEEIIENVSVPVGVSLYEAQSYDYLMDGEPSYLVVGE